MNTLEKLMEKLTVSESPGLEAFDERFGAIGDHAQARRFGQAAELFEQLIDEDIYDFRLAVYYLYHCIDTEQAEGVQAVLKTLNAVFEQNWEAWGPSSNREKVFAKSLAWLFQNSNDLISYHVASQDSTWVLFQARDEELLDGLRDEFLSLSKRLEGPVWSSCGGHLATLQRSLESEYSLLDVAVVSEPKTEVHAEDPVVQEISEDVPVLKKTNEDAVELKASPQFFQLQQKLRAFELLIEKGQYEKAAVVSNDLMALINDFDPRQYFPDLFAGFFGALNRSIQEVRPHLENRDPMTWDTLEQFYKVDLEGFVKD